MPRGEHLLEHLKYICTEYCISGNFGGHWIWRSGQKSLG